MQRRFCAVNKELLLPKAYYFFFFAGLASFYPFMVVFAKQLGISEVAVGVVFSISPLTGMVSMPLYGVIAEKFGIKRPLFLLFNFLNLLAMLSFILLPSSNISPTKGEVSIECVDGLAHIIREGVLDPKGAPQTGKCDDANNDTVKASSESICDLNCLLTKSECDLIPDFCSSEASVNEDGMIPLSMKIGVKKGISISIALLEDNNRTTIDLPATIYQEEGEDPSSSNITTSHADSFCDQYLRLDSCTITCDSRNPVPDLQLEKVSESSSEWTDKTFLMYSILVLLGGIVVAVLANESDAMCLQTLGSESAHLFGVQRQWGTIGFGLICFIAGALVDWYSGDFPIKNYFPSFVLIGIFLSVTLILAWKWEVNEEEVEKSQGFGESILKLVVRPEITVFFITCIFVGACHGLLSQWLFWYIEDIASCDVAKHMKLLQGLIIVIQTFGGEVPFFYISSWFIRYFGHVRCLTLVLVAFGVRFLFYSFIYNPWHILPIELLHGVTFGIFYANMASYAYSVSPAGSVGTIQGIFKAGYQAVGWGLGSLLGGILFQQASGRMAFRIFGIASLIVAVIYHVSSHFIAKFFLPVPQEERDGHIKGRNSISNGNNNATSDEDNSSDYEGGLLILWSRSPPAGFVPTIGFNIMFSSHSQGIWLIPNASVSSSVFGRSSPKITD